MPIMCPRTLIRGRIRSGTCGSYAWTRLGRGLILTRRRGVLKRGLDIGFSPVDLLGRGRSVGVRVFVSIFFLGFFFRPWLLTAFRLRLM